MIATATNITGRTVSGTTTDFTYDGRACPERSRRSNLVKMKVGSTYTAIAGPHYQYSGSTPTQHYYAGGARIGQRYNTTLLFHLTDHLGSTTLTTTASGVLSAELRYRPYGLIRYTTGTLNTPYRYTGQRFVQNTGLYFYNARWYDPTIGRFLAADTIVPKPGDSGSLNRYSYTMNNPLRYVDPTGHFTEEEICTYWGYCDEEAARKGLGDLFDMLWNTSMTWGDLLFLGDESSVTTTAMFVLMSDGEEHYWSGLWSLGGAPVQWSSARSASHKAAYKAEGNVWEGMTRSEALKWVGTVPKVNGAATLGLAEGIRNYQIATYLDLNGTWLLMAGVTIASWPISSSSVLAGTAAATVARVIAGAAVTFDALSLAADVTGSNFLAGPMDASYPVVYYDPLGIGRAPSQLHIANPRGVRP